MNRTGTKGIVAALAAGVALALSASVLVVERADAAKKADRFLN
jgi:hypothetical protein